MDGERFDRLTRLLASAGSRRRAIGAALGLAAVGFGLHQTSTIASRARCRRKDWSERRVKRFIKDAADRYNQPERAMLRVAQCESNYDPCAVNRAGPYYGLFQFLESTWDDTPYRRDDIFDPKSNALAAAWMWKEGRRDEWACQ